MAEKQEKPKSTIIFFPDAEEVEDNYGKIKPIGRRPPADVYRRIAWDMIYLNSLKEK